MTTLKTAQAFAARAIAIRTAQIVAFTLGILAISAPLSTSGAIYTNEPLRYSITNWNGAFDTDRVYLTISGDSIPAAYTEGGSVEFLTTDVAASLFQINFRRTNVAVISSVMSEIYERATNVVATRKPRFLLYQSPHNTLVDAFDVPGQSWSAWETTNNALLAACKAQGTTLLYGEILPFTADWRTVFTNWNAALNTWAATNQPFVKVVPFYNYFKDPTDDAVILPAFSFDLRHLTKLGQTNFAMFLLTNMAGAVCYTSASPAQVDVANTYTNLQSGDTERIPAGATVGWGTNFTISGKAITLQGAGTNSTIIRDDVAQILVTLYSNRLTRISGIQFVGGGRATNINDGMIYMVGDNSDLRRYVVDNVFFNMLSNSAMKVDGALGVMSTFRIIANQQLMGGYHRHQNFNGGSYGDASVATNNQVGTRNFSFYEDFEVTNTLAANHVTVWDGDAGCRYEVRYGTIGKGSLENHGAEAQRLRGGREFHAHNLTFVGNDSGGVAALIRSGTWFLHDITLSGYSQSDFPFNIEDSRVENAVPPWGPGNAERAGADGLNLWHENASTTPFTNGTVSAGHTEIAGQRCSVPVAGSPWTVNQWQGYSIRKNSGKSVSALTRNGTTVTVTSTGHGFSSGDRISIQGAEQLVYNEQGALITVLDADSFTYALADGGGTPTTPATGTIYCFQGYGFSDILSNTVNTVYYRHSSQGSGGPAFFLRFTNSPADTFEIYKVDQVFDGVGRGGGTILSGVSPTRPASNDQTTYPCYSWNNTREGGQAIGFQSVHPYHARENEHWFNATAHPGHTDYTYPHPDVSGQAESEGGGEPSITPGLPAVGISGNVPLNGGVFIR